jgi:undecaprenyl-diphosphatase
MRVCYRSALGAARSRLFSHAPATLVPAVGLRWAFVVGAVFAFGHVARRLHRDGSLQVDTRILSWLRERQSPRLTRAMLALTQLGSAELLTPLSTVATLGLWAGGKRRAALFLGVTAAGSTLMNQVLKLAFHRARPDATLHLSRTTGFAFPSGHSMASAAIYGALAIVARTRYPRVAWAVRTVCGVIVFAVGSSRAYLHVHYPSDVATGWGLGLAWPISLERLILGSRHIVV